MKEKLSGFDAGFNAEKAKWIELLALISRMRLKSSRGIWLEIEKNPITLDSIDRLVGSGWKIEPSKAGMCVCLESHKLILLDEKFRGFERDESLFHEVVHAIYGLPDSRLWELVKLPKWLLDENRAIVEWLARKLRADPVLLRYTVLSFELEPEIYDRASYLAFSNQPEALSNFEKGLQLIFPGLEQSTGDFFKKFRELQYEI